MAICLKMKEYNTTIMLSYKEKLSFVYYVLKILLPEFIHTISNGSENCALFQQMEPNP